MKRLLRLFPRSWRDRYGREFSALLDDIPPGPAVVGDLLLLAMRTRVRAAVAAVTGQRPRSWKVPGPSAGTAAGLVAVGGALWAATFAWGAVMGWGQKVEDLAFILLIAAALCLCVGLMAFFEPLSGGLRVLAGVGRALAIAGSAVLVVALVSAIVLEYPLGIRLGLSPPEYWQLGMFVLVAGSALVVLAAMRTSGIPRPVGAAMLIAAVVLAFNLVPGVDPTDEGSINPVANGGFLSLARLDENWFTTHPITLIAGLTFGIAWLSIALGRRRGEHGLAPR